MSVIDELTELYAHRDILEQDKDAMRAAVIPQEVQEDLDAIDAEFVDKAAKIAERIENLEAEAKNQALAEGKSIQGEVFQVVYNGGGKTVAVKDVLSLATRWEKMNPEIAAELRSIISLKKPSASIQARRGGVEHEQINGRLL